MILGPVFRSELMRTARRRRYYILRFVYGAILLVLFWNALRGDVCRRQDGKDRGGGPVCRGRHFSFSPSCSS